MIKYLLKSPQVPENININKGSIRIIKEPEHYLVKYSEACHSNVKISEANNKLAIEVLNDLPANEEIKINVYDYDRCKVHLYNGTAIVNNTCNQLAVKIDNGTIAINADKAELGNIEANVKVGVINNSSSLSNANANHHEGTNTGFLGGFLNNFQTILPFDNAIKLVGENHNQTSIFEVGNGVINFE